MFLVTVTAGFGESGGMWLLVLDGIVFFVSAVFEAVAFASLYDMRAMLDSLPIAAV
jgi:hypothetical protein